MSECENETSEQEMRMSECENETSEQEMRMSECENETDALACYGMDPRGWVGRRER